MTAAQVIKETMRKVGKARGWTDELIDKQMAAVEQHFPILFHNAKAEIPAYALPEFRRRMEEHMTRFVTDQAYASLSLAATVMLEQQEQQQRN